jgi:hypothetical protein
MHLVAGSHDVLVHAHRALHPKKNARILKDVLHPTPVHGAVRKHVNSTLCPPSAHHPLPTRSFRLPASPHRAVADYRVLLISNLIHHRALCPVVRRLRRASNPLPVRSNCEPFALSARYKSQASPSACFIRSTSTSLTPSQIDHVRIYRLRAFCPARARANGRDADRAEHHSPRHADGRARDPQVPHLPRRARRNGHGLAGRPEVAVHDPAPRRVRHRVRARRAHAVLPRRPRGRRALPAGPGAQEPGPARRARLGHARRAVDVRGRLRRSVWLRLQAARC